MPAPYDMFYTPHDKPQLKVSVSNMLGACNSFTGNMCDYARVAGTPQVTGTTSTDPFTDATIAGTDFPTDAALYEKVTFAGRTCTPTYTATSIGCTVVDPIAGKWHAVPTLIATGIIETTGTPATVDIPLTLTDVTPASITANGGV